MNKESAIIIGAGPCGLAAAIELQRAGLNPLVIEKRYIAFSISQYPTYMNFFSTADRLEIGDIPFTSANEKPSRIEALHYYRTAAQRHGLRIRPYETITSVVRGEDGVFVLDGQDRFGDPIAYSCENVIIATGYFDHPNLLGIPGESLDKVSHFFREAHPYIGMEVAIIGGRNSAIDAALELERVGARVTIVYRGAEYSRSIKPWVRPTIENKVEKGAIDFRFGSRVVDIKPRTITIESEEGRSELPNDFVLALTGFQPDRRFLNSAGVTMEAEGYPTFNEETMESNVPGIYLAGVVASRHEANEIFIESGRFHGHRIAAHIINRSNQV